MPLTAGIRGAAVANGKDPIYTVSQILDYRYCFLDSLWLLFIKVLTYLLSRNWLIFANSKKSRTQQTPHDHGNATPQEHQPGRLSPQPIISPISSALCLSMPSLILINTPAANILTSFSSPPSSPLIPLNIWATHSCVSTTSLGMP